MADELNNVNNNNISPRINLLLSRLTYPSRAGGGNERCAGGFGGGGGGVAETAETTHELELIQSHIAQKPVLRGGVGCACVAREVSAEREGMGERGCARRLGG